MSAETMRDPYDILGVSRSSTEADIKKAFRQKAKQFHPDSNAGDDRAKEKFAEVNAAYEILGDAKKKQQFDAGEIDAEGKERFQGFQGFDGFGGARGGRGGFSGEDIFADILRGFGQGGRGPGAGADPFGGAASRPQSAPAKGRDVSIDTSISLEDYVSKGKAKVRMPSGKTIAVQVPAGFEPGQQIRLKGQGEPSPQGGRPGDALITLKLAKHKDFSVDGADLRFTLALPLYDAVLGTKATVPTLAGPVSLTIPANADTRRAMRVRGRGLPKGKDTVGDLFVDLKIVLPPSGDSGLETLMREWRDVRPYPTDE